MNIAFGALGHSNTMILWISVFGKELSKRRDASVRLKTRGIDVERRIPSVRRETSALGQKPVGLETRPPSEERPASHSSEAAPAEGCAAFPATEAQAPAGSTPDLPEFAKKADDLEAIKQAVDDAASVGGSLAFLSVRALLSRGGRRRRDAHRSISRKSGQADVPQHRTAAARILLPGRSCSLSSTPTRSCTWCC